MSIAPALRALLAAAFCVVLTLAAAPAALAADGEGTPLGLDQAEPARGASPGAGGGDLVRTIVGLAIVLAVIYGLYWVLKQVRAAREEKASGQGLQALATLPLGPNRSLHLVRAGDEVVLVGTGEAGVTPIRTYGLHEARALGLLSDEAATVPVAHAEVLGLPAPRDERRALTRVVDDLRRRTIR